MKAERRAIDVLKPTGLALALVAQFAIAAPVPVHASVLPPTPRVEASPRLDLDRIRRDVANFSQSMVQAPEWYQTTAGFLHEIKLATLVTQSPAEEYALMANIGIVYGPWAIGFIQDCWR